VISSDLKDELKLFVNDFHQFIFELRAHPQERARSGRNGFYIPTKSRDYKKVIQSIARSQWERKPLEGPLFVEMIFKYQRPKSVKRKFHTVKPDLTNLGKIIEDALNKLVWKDDSQICGLTLIKEYGSRDLIELNVFELKG
jgi:Holliday junction resolvase RusA-like endonuclease